MAYFNYNQPNFNGGNYGGGYVSPQPAYPQPMQQQMPQQQAQQPVQQQMPAQPVPQNVNKIYVTSLEDALGRFANVNTITVYHLQDESAEIEVATDGFGKKSYKLRKLSDFAPIEQQKQPLPNYVTEEQASGLQGQITALEERLGSIEKQLTKSIKTTSNKKTEAVDNE